MVWRALPGEFAGASLKRIVGVQLVLEVRALPGEFAGASLKPRFAGGGALGLEVSPRRIRRGLIEAYRS